MEGSKIRVQNVSRNFFIFQLISTVFGHHKENKNYACQKSTWISDIT